MPWLRNKGYHQVAHAEENAEYRHHNARTDTVVHNTGHNTGEPAEQGVKCRSQGNRGTVPSEFVLDGCKEHAEAENEAEADGLNQEAKDDNDIAVFAGIAGA